MAIRYRLSSVLWTIALLAIALGWFCDRRWLEARHALNIQEQWSELDARNRREIQEQLLQRRKDALQLDSALKRAYQLGTRLESRQ